jgi:hypothetical protein
VQNSRSPKPDVNYIWEQYAKQERPIIKRIVVEDEPDA